jgi:hypothetical protein
MELLQLQILENKEKFKSLTDTQKAKIKAFKDNIIDSDNIRAKYRFYIELVRYLKSVYNREVKPFKKVRFNKKLTRSINIDYKTANAKISKNDTIIFSVSPAIICHSALKGECPLYKSYNITNKGIKRTSICYALKNEIQYNESILYKERQRLQFKKLKAWQIAKAFILIKAKNPKIKYIRFNESGDLTLKQLEKVNVIANILKKYNVKIYTYTHNRDIKKHMIKSDNLVINSSHKDIDLSNKFLSYEGAKIDKMLENKEQAKKDKLFLCGANCETCKVCTFSTNLNILCKIH